MNKINITKISPETPVLASYIRRMSSWGENGAFCSEVVAEKKENSNFYGIFYGENFLAGSVIEHDEAKSNTYITVANGSINHFDEIENASREQLTNIAKDLFGEEITVVFPVPTVKKIGTR